jgi:hypothetical protein
MLLINGFALRITPLLTYIPPLPQTTLASGRSLVECLVISNISHMYAVIRSRHMPSRKETLFCNILQDMIGGGNISEKFRVTETFLNHVLDIVIHHILNRS